MNRSNGACASISKTTWKPYRSLSDLALKSILLALLALGAWPVVLPFRAAPPPVSQHPDDSGASSIGFQTSPPEVQEISPTPKPPIFKKAFPPPDDGGKILEVTLHYCQENEEDMEDFYQDFFKKFNQSARLLIVCATSDCESFFNETYGALARAGGREVNTVVVDRLLSIWARDRRVARQSESGHPERSFIPPPQELYTDDKLSELTLAEILWSKGVAPRALTESFILEGGNLVSNQRHIFVGKNVLSENGSRFEDEEEALQTMERIFGKPVIWLEDEQGAPPWFHADMYLAALDETTVALADPTLGLRLLNGRRADKLKWDKISGWKTRLPSGLKVDFSAPQSRIATGLETVKRRLEGLGYKVIRLPALVNEEDEWMVSYTNVLMERDGGVKKVYLPRYAIPALDSAARKSWELEGFQVLDVNVSNVFDLGGAIRCIANVTLREPAPQKVPGSTLIEEPAVSQAKALPRINPAALQAP